LSVAQASFKLEELHTFLDNLPGGVGVYVYDRGTHHLTQVYLNQGYYRLIKAKPMGRENFSGANTVNAVHPEDRKLIGAGLERALTNHTDFSATVRLLTGDQKTYIWANLHGRIVKNEGQVYTLYANIDDVDEQVRKEQEYEERFRMTMQQAGVTSWILDFKTKTVEIISNSGLFASLLQTDSLPEVMVQSGRIHPDDVETFKNLYARLRGGAVYADAIIRFKGRSAAGQDQWWWGWLKYTVLKDVQGHPLRGLGTCQDITDKMDAEAKYKEAVAHRMAANDSLLGYIQLNVTKGIVEDFDRKDLLKKQLTVGMSIDAAVKSVAESLTDEKERRRFLDFFTPQHLLDRFHKGETSVSMEYLRLMPDGKSSWVSTTITMMEVLETKQILAYMYTENLSPDQLEQLVLQRSLGSEVDYVMSVDLGSHLAIQTEFNGTNTEKHLEKEFTYENFLRNLDLYEHVCPEDLERCQQAFDLKAIVGALSVNPEYTFSYGVLTENGAQNIKSVRWFFLSSRKKHLVCVRRDITAINKMERRQRQALQKALQEARLANAAKSDFLSRMSHDIRTPMNGVLGLTRLALDEQDLPQIKDYLRKIQVSGEFLLGLVNDILDLSKVESGKLELYPEPYNQEAFIESITGIIEPLARAKGITFTVWPSGTNFPLLVDKLRLNQIFFNLLSNAVKFTPAGGKVDFYLEGEKQKDGRLSVLFKVSDNGIGIKPEFLPHIFESFSQDPQTARASGRIGSGLGLAIVKNLVELMGGTVTVQSRLGQGTDFTVTLPCQVAAEQLQRQKDLAKAVVLRGQRILLAEDNKINAEIATKLLQKQGVLVEWVEDGTLVLEKFETAPENYYDAVLLDIRMPKLDGLATARQVRALNRKDVLQIPIVALTANAFDEDIRSSLAAGMNAHLAKPLDPALLYKTLAEQIGRREHSLGRPEKK
jgi:signal transduction histidine kinase/PAS domain-containing protein/BarA-like signal transduction histidine kinase